MGRTIWMLLIALLAAPAAPLNAAAPESPALTPVVAGDVSYLVGGVGDTEELAMQELAHDYPLLLAFTQGKGGGYIAGVQVTLKDRDGRTLVDVKAEAPCFFAKLRPGRYSLQAVYEGRVQKRTVDIKERGRVAMTLRWAGPKEPDAVAPGEAEHQARGCWR